MPASKLRTRRGHLAWSACHIPRLEKKNPEAIEGGRETRGAERGTPCRVSSAANPGAAPFSRPGAPGVTPLGRQNSWPPWNAIVLECADQNSDPAAAPSTVRGDPGTPPATMDGDEEIVTIRWARAAGPRVVAMGRATPSLLSSGGLAPAGQGQGGCLAWLGTGALPRRRIHMHAAGVPGQWGCGPVRRVCGLRDRAVACSVEPAPPGLSRGWPAGLRRGCVRGPWRRAPAVPDMPPTPLAPSPPAGCPRTS